MKKSFLLICALAIAGILASLTPATAQPAPAKSAAAKTSFKEVTAQLDPGGNFFLYLGTAQWLDHLSGKVEGWRKTFTGLPNAKPEDVANVNKVFDIFRRLITDSGLETISGVGLSSIEIEPGLYRNKMVLHHYPGRGDGFLWKLCGGAPHPLTGLDLLPANTAFAVFSDADLPLLWTVVHDEVAQSGFPEAQKFLDQLPAQFEQGTQMKWDTLLHSLGGEFGFAITLDESNKVPIPLPTGAINIPDPALFLVLKVNDDAIFNRISDELAKNKASLSIETNGIKMRILPVPIPVPVNLRPTAASSGGYLFIASSDAIVQEAVAVKAGKIPGLKSTAEFQRLSKGIPERGNQFSFMSAKFGRAVMEVQKQALTAQARRDGAALKEFWDSFLNASRAEYSYSVGQNTPTGCYTVGNGSQSAASVVLLPTVAVGGMMAAIAIPNFVKARTTAQRNACINNLRQIDAAKEQWALEQVKKPGDPCTENDIKPYIHLVHGQFPKCPQGGLYSINPIGEAPTCSISGHELP